MTPRSSDSTAGSPRGGRPLLVGVTGGIGAGKSAVVEVFVARGAVAFSADAAVHALYASDPDVRAAVLERWGNDLLASDGTIDRRRIAEIVFTDAVELAWLEALLHPRVAQAWLDFVAAQSRTVADPPSILVAEVPLLFEGNLDDSYDVTVLVTAPLELRLARVGQRADGDVHASDRAALQLDDAAKAQRADVVLANDADRATLQGHVDELLAGLLARRGMDVAAAFAARHDIDLATGRSPKERS